MCFETIFTGGISDAAWKYWIRNVTFKGNSQFVQKVTFEPLMDFKSVEVGNITKATIFKSFLHQSY